MWLDGFHSQTGKQGLRKARAGKGSQDRPRLPRAGLFILARHVLCRNGVCCPPGGPPSQGLECPLGARWSAALPWETAFLGPASPSSSPLFLLSLVSPKMSSLACCLSFLPPPTLLAVPESSLRLKLQENPATAQPHFHDDHKPSILSYIPLPVCIHTQRTHGQWPCKSREVTLLRLTQRRLVRLRAGVYWDEAC